MITAQRLRSIAGYAYERGAQYVREGRVLACNRVGDTLEGIVAGEQKYHVRARVEHGMVIGDCTCPVKYELCKHAVALVLGFLENGEVDAPSALVSDRAFKTTDELVGWATEHEVGYAIALSAVNLVDELGLSEVQKQQFRWSLTRMTFREVGSLTAAERNIGLPRLAVSIAEAVRDRLDRLAKAIRDGKREESKRPASIDDPVLAPLWNRLVALRKTLRSGGAAPRSRAARDDGAWSFERKELLLAWTERERILHPVNHVVWAIEAKLGFPNGGDPQPFCTCGPQPCTHVVALVDATLDRLADPAYADELRAITTEMLRPGWSRALEQLAKLDIAVDKPKAVIELWWQVQTGYGPVTLTALVKKQLKRGGFSSGSKLSPAKVLDEYRDVLSEQDLQVAEQLASWSPGTGRGAATYAVRAFRALVGHPRVVLADAPDVPLTVKVVPLGFNANPSGDVIRLEASIEGERCHPKQLGAMLDAFAPSEPLLWIDEQRPRLLLIEVTDEARQLFAVLQKHGDEFPPEAHEPLLDRLARIETRMPLTMPAALRGQQLANELVTIARLQLHPDASLELELFVRVAPNTPLFPPGAGPRDILSKLPSGERGYIRRALGEELGIARASLLQLPGLVDAEEGPPNCFQVADPDASLAIVAAAQHPPPGLEIEWVDYRPRVVSGGGPESLRVKIERKKDWFGINGDLKIESGKVELAILLDAVRRQQKYVRLDDDRWLELSETLRTKLQAVADQTFVMKDRIELSPGAVPAVIALGEAGATVQEAPAWKLMAEQLVASLKLRPKPPAALEATLRDYQIEGHAWMTRLAAWGAGGCLADDMGLGKTVQAIALLLDRGKHGPALVLAPTSVAFNWVNELERFAPTLRPVVYAEQVDRKLCLSGLGKRDVLIVSYGLLARDAELLAERTFATLVVDEAQALKNANTRRAKAARALNADFRIALSGTPFENHLGELWSLYSVVFPGLLGSWEQFRQRFATPIERDKDADAGQALSRLIRPFMLRRTKDEVAKELPPRTEIRVQVALSEEEQALYEDARLAAVTSLGEKGANLRDEQRRMQVLAALTRLRLLASHPKLYDPGSTIASSKLRRLLELLEELKSSGHRALVFSQFTSHLAIVRAALEAGGYTLLYLDGGTPAKQRAKLIDQFQGGDGDVFLISLKAGGTGINLTAADYVIHLDPWWNPAVEDQATDRTHRIGQTKPVTVYRLVARGTIEEQILALHADKRALVSGILDGTDVAARLTVKDLLSLLDAAPKSVVADDDREMN